MTTPPNIAALAGALTGAQMSVLFRVCQTNGGGVSIRCKVEEDAVYPSHGPTRKLFEKGLIQGKAGSYETVVHTRDGLAMYRYLKEQNHDQG